MASKAVLKAIQRVAENGRRSLSISNRSLTEIPEELCGLTHLTKLEMWSNDLRELPSGFSALSSLEYLDFSGNKFNEIPVPIFDLRELKSLLLGDNQINEIPDEIARLSNLVSLTMAANPIETVSPAIGELQNLEVLQLGSDGSAPFPAGIANLEKLEFLILSGYNLTEFPDEVFELENLERLWLVNCGLQEIPEKVGSLSKLQVLYLADNDLASLPESVFEMAELRGLFLQGNPRLPIFDVPDGALPNLVELAHGGMEVSYWDPETRELEVVEDSENLHISSAVFVNADQGFVGATFRDGNGRPAKSTTGEVWTEFDIPGMPEGSVVGDVIRTGGWVAATGKAPAGSWDRDDRPGPSIALSKDCETWSVLDLTDLVREDEHLAVSGIAVSGDAMLAHAYRTPRSGSEKSVLLRGPLTGPLRVSKAPMSNLWGVIATPVGFVAHGGTRRGGERTKVFHAKGGSGWVEVGGLDGWFSLSRVNSVLVAYGQTLAVSLDWGLTWKPVSLGLGAVSETTFMSSSVGHAGFAVSVLSANSNGRYSTSVWFSPDGVEFIELKLDALMSPGSHADVMAVADDFILSRSRTREHGSGDWIRLPLPN